MTKFLILILAACGAWLLLKHYYPSAWDHGFTVQGYFVSAAVVVVAIVCFLAYRLKAK